MEQCRLFIRISFRRSPSLGVRGRVTEFLSVGTYSSSFETAYPHAISRPRTANGPGRRSGPAMGAHRGARRAAAAAAALAGALAATASAQSCELATLFAHLGEVQEACCGGNDCSSGYPGGADECTAECGEIFEPFWDGALLPALAQPSGPLADPAVHRRLAGCGEMLAAMGVGGTEGMETFYDTCLAVRPHPSNLWQPHCSADPSCAGRRRSTRQDPARRIARRA